MSETPPTAAWSRRVAREHLVPLFEWCGFHPDPSAILVGRFNDDLGRTYWKRGRPIVVLSDELDGSRIVLWTLIHELTHCSLGSEVEHEDPRWADAVERIGLLGRGYGLTPAGAALHDHIRRTIDNPEPEALPPTPPVPGVR